MAVTVSDPIQLSSRGQHGPLSGAILTTHGMVPEREKISGPTTPTLWRSENLFTRSTTDNPAFEPELAEGDSPFVGGLAGKFIVRK